MKRKKPVDHKPRTAKLYEKQGWLIGNVECKTGKFSRDLFGFADLIGFRSARASLRPEVVLIQVTSGSHHAARRTKILENLIAYALALMGVEIHLVSWSMPAGSRVYVPRAEIVYEGTCDE